MRRLAAALATCLAWAGGAHAQGMLASKHNLSVSGPGTIKASPETGITQICVFCHTPHNATPARPLWNHTVAGTSYTPYGSASLQSTVGQPNGYSRLCLSCHDGTIALGSVTNLGGQSTTINFQNAGPGGTMPPGRTLLGTNLSNDHPVSFAFNAALTVADGELTSPSTLTGAVRLYEGATPGIRDSVQCTTCHDPHSIANPKFLRKPFPGRSDNLCLTCHVKPGWVGSSHESATTKFFGGTLVSDLSCGACHTPHTLPGAPRLLRNGATGAGAAAIQLTCYQCHAPSTQGGITFDVQTQFAKPRHHPVGQYTGHEPVFTVATPPENALNTGKHAECPDCHNPHRVTAANKHEGMRGVDLTGNAVQDVTQDRDIAEYEICFRCHGDSYPSVIGSTVLGDPSGTVPTSNKRIEFQTANSSRHPVGSAGHNASSNLNDQLSPNGLSTTSVIVCTDCHNNDFYSGPSFPGVVSRYTSSLSEPKGPHGSNRFNLLRARFWNVLPGPSTWSSTNFDLCFLCHDVSRLVTQQSSPGARTNFYDQANGKNNLHFLHLVDRVDKAQAICKSCHYNIHSNVDAANTQYRVNGIVYSTANAAPITTTRLLNFHPNIRPIRGNAKPEWWFDTTTRQRRCFLQCHQAASGNPGGVIMDGNNCSGISGSCKNATYTPPSAGDIR